MSKVKYKPPKGYNDAMAYLRVPDAAAAIAFYEKAFDAKERYRLMMGDRVGHAELEFGESCVMLSAEFPEMGVVGPRSLGGTTVTMCLYVADVDAVVERALADAQAARAGRVLRRSRRTGRGSFWLCLDDPDAPRRRLSEEDAEAPRRHDGRGSSGQAEVQVKA
jgi:uncharacterized glyoxalase superfamily protein PhnB